MRPPASVLLGTALLAYWRWGYQFGASDQDEMGPLVLARLDPALFTRDWFVQSQSGFSVRTYFAELVAAVARGIGLEAATALLTAAALLGVLYGVWRLARALGATPLAAATALPLVVVTTAWTLGGNQAVAGLLTPETAAWALAVPGLALAAERRVLPAAVLLGLAAWLHPLVGGHTALLAVCASAVAGRWREALGLGAGFAVAAAPIAVPVLLQQVAEPASADGGISTFRLLVELRLPHHHLPSAFGAGSYARFGLLAAAGLAALVWLRRRDGLRHAWWVAGYLAAVAAFAVLGAVGVEVFHTLAVAKLQVFKMTVSAQVVLSVLVAMAGAALVPAPLAQRTEALLRGRAALGGAVAAIAVTGLLAVAGAGRPAAVYQPGRHAATDLGRVEAWAREQTPADAVFLVPPSNDTFRSRARRAVVVNHKSFPFQAPAMRAWLGRLRAVAPAPLPARGLGWTTVLDSAYHARAPEAWAALGDRFDAGYVLLDRSRAAAPPGEPVAASGPWALYALAR